MLYTVYIHECCFCPELNVFRKHQSMLVAHKSILISLCLYDLQISTE